MVVLSFTRIKSLLFFLPFVCICSFAKPTTGTPMQFGAKADGITVDYDAIQRSINTFDIIYFPPGTYLLDDRDYIRIPSDKELYFDKKADIKFVNTKRRQFGAVFYVQGNNVTISGLRFSSEEMIPRENLTNGTGRTGLSSLATVIMSHGKDVTLKDISIKNAEYGLFFTGSNILIENVAISGSQPLYAFNCTNLTVKNLESVMTAKQSGLLDHHIYLKGECDSIVIENCRLSGGETFAIQLSADYDNKSHYPRNVSIKRTSVYGATKFIVIDEGKSSVFCEDLMCIAKKEDTHSCFASNRGGVLIVRNTTITNYRTIEHDMAPHLFEERGRSYYYDSTFDFSHPDSRGFDLVYSDGIEVERCEFNYPVQPNKSGYIIRTDKEKDSVSHIVLSNNVFYLKQASSSPIEILSQGTKASIINNRYYNLGDEIDKPFSEVNSNFVIKENTYTGINLNHKLSPQEEGAKFKGKATTFWIRLTHRFKNPEID